MDYCSEKELPIILQAKDVQAVLGISKGKTYELMNSSDFPTIYLNRRMVVQKDAFFEWLNQDKRKIKRRAIYESRCNSK
jgi:predicted DNA-binding transcriptional regulator AlpA